MLLKIKPKCIDAKVENSLKDLRERIKFGERKTALLSDHDVVQKEVAKQLKPFYEKQNKFNKAVSQTINKHTDQINNCNQTVLRIGDYLGNGLQNDICKNLFKMLVDNNVIRKENDSNTNSLSLSNASSSDVNEQVSAPKLDFEIHSKTNSSIINDTDMDYVQFDEYA
jgi:hypothetical protein